MNSVTPTGGLTNRVIGDGGPWRVLIVDDEETIRLALSKFLRTRGYNVQTAESAAAALDLLHRGKYVLMLCDVRMPGLSGVELGAHQRFSIPLLWATSLVMVLAAVLFGVLAL